eukprot:GHVR01012077.1.p1 GENE.GHVR01012077.1~~GHVR01012077.1.p1  ORF type:complete len:288 (+),score=63.22 GHVR01012077.1:516-1379(+)
MFNTCVKHIVFKGVNAEELSEYFSKYGPVESAQIMYSKVSHKPRGFGFVYFGHYQQADCAVGQHNIKGKWCETKRATPNHGSSRHFQNNFKHDHPRDHVRYDDYPPRAPSRRYDDGMRQQYSVRMPPPGPYDAPPPRNSSWRGPMRGVSSSSYRGGGGFPAHPQDNHRGVVRGRDEGGYGGGYGSGGYYSGGYGRQPRSTRGGYDGAGYGGSYGSSRGYSGGGGRDGPGYSGSRHDYGGYSGDYGNGYGPSGGYSEGGGYSQRGSDYYEGGPPAPVGNIPYKKKWDM